MSVDANVIDRHKFDGHGTASGMRLDCCAVCHFHRSHKIHFTDGELKDLESEAKRVAFYAEQRQEKAAEFDKYDPAKVGKSPDVSGLESILKQASDAFTTGQWSPAKEGALTQADVREAFSVASEPGGGFDITAMTAALNQRLETRATVEANRLAREKVRSMQAEGPKPGTDTSSFSAGAEQQCCALNCRERKIIWFTKWNPFAAAYQSVALCAAHDKVAAEKIEMWKCIAPGCEAMVTERRSPFCVNHKSLAPNFGTPIFGKYDSGGTFHLIPPDPQPGNATFEIKTVDFSALEKQLLEVIDVVWQEKDKLISKFNREASILSDQQASLLNTRDILRAHQKK